MQNSSSDHPSSWLDQPLLSKIQLNWEFLIFALILVVTIATRFYNLEARVMSHDENSHVYYSWLLYQGRGYAHDPVTHGRTISPLALSIR
jgi:predicted membrane-bound mannosyltransferase